jgi:proline iminopeptidase
MVLCNGGPGCCDYLEPVSQVITDLSQVIRFEQRGCGRSDQTGPYDIETSIEDLESIRKHYKLSKWIIGGHSYGPDLALAYSLAYPEHVLGMICISGGVVHKDTAWSEQYNRFQDQGKVPPMLYPPNMEVNSQIGESWRQYVRNPNLLRRIAGLDIPALFVYGEKDIRPSWPVEQLAQLLPQGHFEIVKGAPHAIWVDHAAELKIILRNFVTQIINKNGLGQSPSADI